ncbi:MAG: heavy-metal-associated domain-containing protein [Candidatus Nanopelagicales bacterium]
MAAVTRTLDIAGMHCHSCAAIIDETVAEVPGVTEVRTSRPDNASVVTFDDSQVGLEKIIAAVAEVGYAAAARG